MVGIGALSGSPLADETLHTPLPNLPLGSLLVIHHQSLQCTLLETGLKTASWVFTGQIGERAERMHRFFPDYCAAAL